MFTSQDASCIQEDRYRTIGVRYICVILYLGQGEWVDDCAVPDLEWHHKLISKSFQKMKGIISRRGVSDNTSRNLPIVYKVQCAETLELFLLHEYIQPPA